MGVDHLPVDAMNGKRALEAMRVHRCWLYGLSLIIALLLVIPGTPAVAGSKLGDLLSRAQPSEIAPGADAFGPPQGDPPVVPVLKAGQTIGYAFLNADVVDATGYSGKPIDIIVGLDRDARITGAKLVEHHEPIMLVGIPVQKVENFIHGYVGKTAFDEAAATKPPVDIVSGATVSMIVIGDSIMRSSRKVAQSLKLGGAAAVATVSTAPLKQLDMTKSGVVDWQTLLGDGSVRRLTLSNKEIDDAFRRAGHSDTVSYSQEGAADAPFVDIFVALASVPTIGRSLLGDEEYEQLKHRLAPGEQAVLIAGDGTYSFRGSGYVRGGIFDRIEIIQGDHTIRFRDSNYKRIGSVAPHDAPDFPEIGLFVIPQDRSFDPASPWRVQFLVQRPTGAMSKAYITEDIGYTTPDKYLMAVPAATPQPASTASAKPAAMAAALEPAAPALWQKIWRGKVIEIGVLLLALATLTGIFFFQDLLVKQPVFYERLRLGFLAFTLIWLGWYEHAQLSVVNVFTFFNALRGDFHWDYFLMDPLVFILWCSVAAALLFWGRGAYCGWLCPFGALQEWSNRIARWCRVPQMKLPFGLHQRLWPVKYIIFLALFGLSLNSLGLAEKLAEIEPFKTAIILHFVRDWWFVLLALALLVPGLVIERFYCRYLCPLGGALAVPARLRMFDWLRRYRECGSPCQRCAGECPVQAIHPEGQININECIQCLNCQVLYHHDRKCPVMIQKRIKREKRLALSSASMRPGAPAKGKTLETADSDD